MSAEKIDFLLLGGGLAAATAASTLRREGATGSIKILSADNFPPYHRPRLSKQYLLGSADETAILIHPKDYYKQQGIDLALGVVAQSIDTQRQTVTTKDGGTIDYEKLLIATGAAPKLLRASNRDLSGIFYLRRKSDCEAIRKSAQAGRRAVVLGASFLGMETALSLIELGLHVTIIEYGKVILPHVRSLAVSKFFTEYAERCGATILLNDTIVEINGGGEITSVATGSGASIPCDLLIVCIGVTPATEFLSGSGIALEDGYVMVDEMLRTSAENVFAAGDVTNFFDPVFSCRRHIEHWDNAVRQGRLAAKNMLNQRHRYDEVSYFYCGIGELTFNMLGMPSDDDEHISRGALEERSYALLYMKADVPRAVFSLGRPAGETRLMEGLIRHRINLHRHLHELTDPASPLDGLSTQTVLILQGGGALGAFECGVVKALEEGSVFPDIVAGVSIGAINGAIIASHPRNAAAALESFWADLAVQAPSLPHPEMRDAAAAAQILFFGVPKFFTPRWMSPFCFFRPWTSFYDTSPMKRLIATYVDFKALRASPVRLIISAVNVVTAQLEVFDSYVDDLTPDHIMASGSLPPGFPWTVVDGKPYWDGGIVSNSPLDLVVERCGPDGKRVFIVDLFSSEAALPRDMGEVLTRRDEIVYSERVRSDVRISELTDAYRSMVNIILSEVDKVARSKIEQHPRFIQLMGNGASTTITRFVRRRMPGESSSRDYNFSSASVHHNLSEGYALAKHTLSAEKAVASTHSETDVSDLEFPLGERNYA